MIKWQIWLIAGAIFLLFFIFSKKFRTFVVTTVIVGSLIAVAYYFYLQSIPHKPSYNPKHYLINIITPCKVSSKYEAQVLQWCGLITHYAKIEGLDPNLVAAVITKESRGNPEACNPEACNPAGHMMINNIEICGSKSGAIGLMQIMPSDGLAAVHPCGCFTTRPPALELLNPEVNIAYGTDMLSASNAAADPRNALFSYGPANVGYAYADDVLATYYANQ